MPSVFAVVGSQVICLPLDCICGAALSVDHALNCNTGGFPLLRHNDIHDITANLLTEICSDVGESLSYCTANVKADARVDISLPLNFGPSIRNLFLM